MNSNTSTPNRGTKRSADDTLDDEQRFTKRFNLLNLGTTAIPSSQTPPDLTQPPVDRDGSKLYIPVSSQSQPPTPPFHTDRPQDSHMHLDDTSNRVYIHDLDAELASISPTDDDEETLIFLPDIEKKLSRIPRHVLRGSSSNSNKTDEQEKQSLVLYSVPSSLTVPVEQDSVRKLIIEARQRARDKSALDNGVRQQQQQQQQGRMHDHYEAETAHGFGEEEYRLAEEEEGEDPDAMDLG